MAGHNKWSKIKHKKAVTDAAKSKLFSKLAKLIASESKKAKGDETAPGLRAAIEKAKAANMPKDNIKRAIEKGAGADAKELEPVVYETYGPGGVAVIIVALTDNRNRTAAEVKHTLSKNGYELATPGSASWAFTVSPTGEYTPNSTIELSDQDIEKLSTLVDALEELEDVQEVFTNAA